MDEVKRRRQSGAELQQAFLDFLASQGLEPPRAELQQAFLELVASHGLGETGGAPTGVPGFRRGQALPGLSPCGRRQDPRLRVRPLRL